MRDRDLKGTLDFLKLAEKLKDTLRNSHTSTGRHESTAEHTWRACLMAMVFMNELEGVDVLRLLKMLIIHDLGEAISGDIAAINQHAADDKNIQERKDLQQLITPLPDTVRKEILDLWDEYNEAKTREALLAKSFDKLETILQHNQGINTVNFDYGFNIDYGRKFTDTEELTRKIRKVLDQETKLLAKKNGTL